MDNPCFFDGKGVYYKDELERKVYIISPYIMRELTLYGYVTRDDVLETISREVEEASHPTENDLRTSKISFDVETETLLLLESKVNYLSSRLENLCTIVNVLNKSMDQVHSLETQVSELKNEVNRLRDTIVSYNIQSEDVELAGFFDELDKD